MDVQRLDIVLDKKSNRKVVNQRFRLLQTIGQGQFGKVLLAEDLTQDHGLVAIKTINRVDRAKLITKTYLSHTTKICREIQIMKECDHPNVVKLYQVIDDLKFDKILLVLEYCNFGEIDWKKYNHFHEKYHKDGGKGITLNKIVRDVVNGLEYLHSYKQIIHRDLKPSNLLISSDRTIKISDFGVSLILENNTNDDKELGKTMGTPAFYAPELCQFVNNRLSMLNEADMARSKIDARIDIWSLGVVMYCLFFHQLPFEGHNEFSLFKTIVNGELKFPRTRESSHVRLEDLRELELLKELIKQILAKDPNSRPTLTEIKHHKFTTFELSKKETEKFYSFNKNIISQQDPLAAEAWEADNRMSHKIKRLFGAGKNEPSIPAPPMSRPISVEHPTKQIKGVDALDLENVDDLLDSYLDDSSSMGSLSEEEGASSVIDTTQILSSIKMDAEKLPHSTLKKSDSAQSRLSRSSVPPPLKLSTSSFSVHKGGSTSSFQPPASPFSSGQRTPSTATSNTVTIGEGSPSSIKSIFSPSRRFFAKIKPTINSLYSPTHGEGHTTSFSDLAPPPSFGRSDRRGSMSESISSAQSGFVPSGSGLGSRKNSISSTRSNGLSKMSSSSSSLNLHGYLTDESSTSFSGKWQKAVNREIDTDEEDDQHNSSDSEVGDQTLTYSPQTGTMDQYLDRLQS